MLPKNRSIAQTKIGMVDYETICKLTGKSKDSLYQDHTRGNLNLDDLASVVVYVARHATPELKTEILLSMTERDLDLSVANKKRKAFMEKRSLSRKKDEGP